MPKLNKFFTLEVTVEQFVNACSAAELHELEILLASPRVQAKMKQEDKFKYPEVTTEFQKTFAKALEQVKNNLEP
ncbi:hypothetical protein C943_03284 [Mariniradius saccharolyticus AK6]|uniref:Uncharacterized protein n=1 Tax=Mariniradius saccharolyticus AK6 TaxID=1239962 RepID=M7Y1H9_9BACT|nr:hypothetical protein [Mariniradius saccharolyticus]EMS34597.1 hypothetical protein C943_03284 [Mariniradius saccharolyticus AK6]